MYIMVPLSCQVNTIIQEIALSYNGISDEGARHIANALSVNDYLRILDLSWNKLRPQGIAIILAAVQVTTVVHYQYQRLVGVKLQEYDALPALSARLKVKGYRLKQTDATERENYTLT